MKNKKRNNMFWPTIIMGIIALILFVIAVYQGGDKHLVGVKSALVMTINIMPLLLFAFIIGGLVQQILPNDLLTKWVGIESGYRGIFIGTLAGALTPGGPYVSLPIVAALLKSGAGIGTMVAFLSSWSLWAIARLPMEVGILGWKFTIIRLISVIIFPPITGFLANFVSRFFYKV